VRPSLNVIDRVGEMRAAFGEVTFTVIWRFLNERTVANL
jgi:hypothetical protein